MNELYISNQDYEQFLKLIDTRVNSVLKSGRAIFETSSHNLWDIYLNSFDDPAVRQYHNCNCCQHFIRNFGHLAVISPDGTLLPLVWAIDLPADHLYFKAVTLLGQAVCRAKVLRQFFWSGRIWGRRETGDWIHLSAHLWHNSNWQVVSPEAARAASRETYNLVRRTLAKFSKQTLDTAQHLVTSRSLYRSETLGPALAWLHAAKVAYELRNGEHRLWSMVVGVPDAFTHAGNSVLGALLQDIEACVPFDQMAAAHAQRMNPETYNRAQAAPRDGQIEAAERLVQELGIASALPRRYASMHEALPHALWLPSKPMAKEVSGVFGHLRKEAEAAAPLVVPPKPITVERLVERVLPSAAKLFVQRPAGGRRDVFLVTAQDPDAPPILAWDRPECRNPVSWFYRTGVDSVIKERVRAAGGRVDKVDLRISLSWYDRNDLDLHVSSQLGTICFHNQQVGYGSLDVDMNVRGESTTPVENVRWPTGRLNDGSYGVSVNFYRRHDHQAHSSPFTVEVEFQGKLYQLSGTCHRQGSMAQVANITKRGDKLSVVPHKGIQMVEVATATALTDFSEVLAVVRSPNLWNGTARTNNGEHLFFLVDGMEDPEQGVGRGFFAEMLRSEVRPARAVLEAHNAHATLGTTERPARGVGFSKDADINVMVRAVMPDGTSMDYMVDRWE